MSDRSAGRRTVSLLDLDADLGARLPAERVPEADAELRVAVQRLDTGLWDVSRLALADPGHLGLLVVDGVLAREVMLEDEASVELLGAGDVMRLWHVDGERELLRYEVRWSVLGEARLAVLDRRLVGSLARYPEVYAALLDRFDRRAERLALAKAIAQLNRVDRRLLALLWHLASRWGRVTADGVLIPLALSHRLLANLIGARRPTVTTVLAGLVDRGDVVRKADGTWLLTADSRGRPPPVPRRFVPTRRRVLGPGESAGEEAPADGR